MRHGHHILPVRHPEVFDRGRNLGLLQVSLYLMLTHSKVQNRVTHHMRTYNIFLFYGQNSSQKEEPLLIILKISLFHLNLRYSSRFFLLHTLDFGNNLKSVEFNYIRNAPKRSRMCRNVSFNDDVTSYFSQRLNLTNATSSVSLHDYTEHGEWEILSTVVTWGETSLPCCPDVSYPYVMSTLYLKRYVWDLI